MNFKRNPYIVYGLFAAVVILVIVVGIFLFNKSSQLETIESKIPPSMQHPRPPPRPQPPRPQPQQPIQQNKPIMKQVPPQPHPDVETPIGDGTGSLVLFYSERCGHSVNMMPAWEEMKNILGSTNQVDIIGFEQSKNPQEIQQNNIKGFPTIRFYPDGFPSQNFIEYRGPRTAESLIKFSQSGGQEV